MMKMRLAGLALVGLAALAPASAEASFVSYNALQIGPSLTDFAQPWAFQKFDQTLGSLLSVRLELDVDLTTDITVTNNSSGLNPAAPSDGSVDTKVKIYLQDAGLNLVGGTSPLGPGLVNNTFGTLAVPAFEFFGLGTGQTLSSGVLFDSVQTNNLYMAPAVLGEFSTVGLGFMNLDVTTLTSTILSFAGGNVVASQSTFGTLNGKVTYEYLDVPPPPISEVPEPTSMFLLGSGAVALVRMRRKQQAK